MKKFLIFLVLVCFSIATYAHSALVEKTKTEKAFVKKDLSVDQSAFILFGTPSYGGVRQNKAILFKSYSTTGIKNYRSQRFWKPSYSLYRHNPSYTDNFQATRSWRV